MHRTHAQAGKSRVAPTFVIALAIAAAVILLTESGGGRATPALAGVGNPEQPMVEHTIVVTKRLVDANGAPAAGDLSGYQFLLTGSPGCTGTMTTPVGGTVSLRVLAQAGGTCTITEAAVAGAGRGQFVRFEPENTIRIPTIFASVTNTVTTVTAINRVTAAPGGTPSGATRNDALVAGCNNLALLFAAGTPLTQVAAAVTPAGSLGSIFRYDNARGVFAGFAPGVPEFVNDYRTVGARFEAVFLCMRSAGTLTQPAA